MVMSSIHCACQFLRVEIRHLTIKQIVTLDSTGNGKEFNPLRLSAEYARISLEIKKNCQNP